MIIAGNPLIWMAFHYSLKTALFVLLIVGFLLMIRRRGKEDILLLSYPFFTILIGLGFFGIVRPREHFTLIPFYVIIAAVFTAGLLLIVSYPSLKVAASHPGDRRFRRRNGR